MWFKSPSIYPKQNKVQGVLGLSIFFAFGCSRLWGWTSLGHSRVTVSLECSSLGFRG